MSKTWRMTHAGPHRYPITGPLKLICEPEATSHDAFGADTDVQAEVKRGPDERRPHEAWWRRPAETTNEVSAAGTLFCIPEPEPPR
jgi:hypothetical protein